MWKIPSLFLSIALVIGFQSRNASAQPAPAGQSSVITRMMAFDKNSDGKLTKEEVTDERLHALFDQADANKDGTVTGEELTAVAATLGGDAGPGDGGGPGGRGRGGPGDFGGPGGPGGPGGRGRGPGGPGGPPEPGQILPPFMRDSLNLTAEQSAQLDALQKEVTEKLDKILTDEQKAQLQQMRNRGGRGGRGGPPQGRGF